MIIGLTGTKESGRDTVGAYLVKQHDFERRAFADPLKKSVAALLDIPYHEIDKFKGNDTVFVSTGYKNEPSETMLVSDENRIGVVNHMWSPIRELTFNDFVHRCGKVYRDVFGENFLLDHVLPYDGYYSGRKIVITDIKFENEAGRVRHCGGFVVKVNRPGLTDKDHHRSEQDLPNEFIDYHLRNVSTLDALYKEIEQMLTELGSAEPQIRSILR